MLSLHWKGGLAFETDVPSGRNFVLDALPESGGAGLGPSPVEAFLSAAAACSGIDVILILKKMRQPIDAYSIEVEWERVPEGQFPRPVTSMVVRHVLTGKGLDPEAIEKAVNLSDEKYCSIIATLRTAPTVTSEFKILEGS